MEAASNGGEAISCYLKDGRLVVSPLRRDRSGARLEAEPVLVVSGVRAEVSELVVDAVRRGLQESTRPLVIECDHKDYKSPVAKSVGAKNERDFLKGTRYCCVERVKLEYWVTPGVPVAGGFDFTAEGEERIAAEDPPGQPLAEAILRVLDSASPHR